MREVPCGYCGMVHSFYGMTIAPTVCHNCGNPFHRHEEKQMPTPRPHYKERIAHAEGYEIEFREAHVAHAEWGPCQYPMWDDEFEYRVKPETKPDRRHELWVEEREGGLDIVAVDTCPNLRLTFDGETGALKHAEVIQQS